MFTMKPVVNQTIGEALKPYMVDNQRPVECVELGTEHVIPWSTLTKDLLQTTVEIREIPGMLQNAYSTGKKLEKRNSLSSDSFVSLKHWFDYVHSIYRDSPSLADMYELKCLTESPTTTTISSADHPLSTRGQEIADPTEPVANTENDFQQVSLRTAMVSGSSFPTDRVTTADRLSSLCKQMLSIKPRWEELVHSKQELSIREQKKQAAIWEVLITEVNYIRHLRNILNIYVDPFNRHREKVFPSLDPTQIFNNLEQVYQANLRLWFLYLYKAYSRIEEQGELMRAQILEPGFMQIPQLFWPYYNYCLDLPRCQKYLKHKCSTNKSFNTFIKWADSMSREHREPLWDQLAGPFKRVTQYCLMLENIRKYCDDQEEIASTDRMINQVSNFVRTIDNNISQWEPREQMHALVDMLLFPDYNENPGDGYQYFYDNFKRMSLLEDIELPASVVLTVPEVRTILDSLVLDKSNSAFFGSMVLDDSDLISPTTSPMTNATINKLLEMDRHGTLRGSQLTHSPRSPLIFSNRSNSTKELNNLNSAPESIRVSLTKWIPPMTFDSAKLSPSILDRLSASSAPIGLRRRVPRALLHKGSLRYRDRQRKWTDATCFLLTDQLLITKSSRRDNQDRYKVCKLPIRLDKLLVKKLNEAGYFACAALDDFHMIISLYTFFTNANYAEEWCTQIRKAKENYVKMMSPEILIATPLWPSGGPSITEQPSGPLGSPSSPGHPPSGKGTLLLLSRKNNPVGSKTETSQSTSQNPKPSGPTTPVSREEHSLIITDTRARSPGIYGKQVTWPSQAQVTRAPMRTRHNTQKSRSVFSGSWSELNVSSKPTANEDISSARAASSNAVNTTLYLNGNCRHKSNSTQTEASSISSESESIRTCTSLNSARPVPVSVQLRRPIYQPEGHMIHTPEGSEDDLRFVRTSPRLSIRMHYQHDPQSSAPVLVRQTPTKLSTDEHPISGKSITPTNHSSVHMVHVNGTRGHVTQFKSDL